MGRSRSRLQIVLLGSALATWPACGDNVGPATSGYLEISISAVGLPITYGLRILSVDVGTETHRFTPHFSLLRLVLAELEPADYTLTLGGVPSGVPADCTVADGSERTVTVAPGGRHFVKFELECTGGTVQIMTSTTGVDPDPDGYQVEVSQPCYYYYDYQCGSVLIPAPVNGTVIGTIATGLTRYSYVARLTDVASNCETPAPVSFDYPDQAYIAFTVTCTAASGSRGPRR